MKNFPRYSFFVIGSLFIGLFVALYPIKSQAAGSFSDISNHTYRESIQFLSDRGIIKGYTDGTFGPDRAVNRAEILKIILEADLSGNIPDQNNCFPDVHNEWFAKYVCYAKENAIIKGYVDGTFKPGQNVLVAEALKISLESFNETIDQSSKTPWYEPYINFVHNNTIFSKYALLPTKEMTRGEMAYLIHQLILKKEGKIQFTGIRNIKTAGCGKTAPMTPPTESVVNGLARHYITVIGNNYNKDTPIKLIFAFHGRTNANTLVRTYYDIEEESNGNAIIVYPSGLPEEGPKRNWSNGSDPSSKLRDFALFDQLVEEFSANYCINKDQIFVVGHSLGAWFTNSLSCARGDIIRAIGSVGGGTTINTCRGPVAALIMQNPDDNLSPMSAGITARDQMVRQNSCDPTATTPMGPAGGNCVLYTKCQADAPVIWCPHSDSTNERGGYYPHTWPDFAGEMIWNFFNLQK